jgi:hypothetical protein
MISRVVASLHHPPPTVFYSSTLLLYYSTLSIYLYSLQTSAAMTPKDTPESPVDEITGQTALPSTLRQPTP